MDNQLSLVETPMRHTPSNVVELAIEKGATIEQLEKLLELQERWERNEAKKAYMEAMAAFKANPPKIEKNRRVEYGNTKYRHATLDNVTEKINAALSAHGLHASWTTKQENKEIFVTCKISHILGHSEETTLSAPPDTSGGKNAIQAIGSSVTYLERYTLFALTGLAAEDQDNDGMGDVECLSESQLSTVRDYLDNNGINEAAFLKFMKVDKVEEIRAADYDKAIAALRAKVKK